MADKLRWDIDNENFSNYFEREAALLSDNAIEELPKEVVFKLFKKGHRVDSKAIYRLGFLSKLYVLIKALRKRVIIIVEDQKEGMDAEAYFNYMELVKSREFDNTKNADQLKLDATFVLGNKELVDTFAKLNMLSVGGSYNYLIGAKNHWYKKSSEWRKQMDYIVGLLNHYESMRKPIATKQGISMADWVVLTYLYDGKEKSGVYLYKEKFKYSFNCSATKIKGAFGNLQRQGYIQKTGESRSAKFSITPLGVDKINAIMKKNILNY